MKSFIIQFYNTLENLQIKEVVKAAGVGANAEVAVEQARDILVKEYPEVMTYCWNAIEHHSALKPGKLE
jgi:hypothetical protein